LHREAMTLVIFSGCVARACRVLDILPIALPLVSRSRHRRAAIGDRDRELLTLDRVALGIKTADCTRGFRDGGAVVRAAVIGENPVSPEIVAGEVDVSDVLPALEDRELSTRGVAGVDGSRTGSVRDIEEIQPVVVEARNAKPAACLECRGLIEHERADRAGI